MCARYEVRSSVAHRSEHHPSLAEFEPTEQTPTSTMWRHGMKRGWTPRDVEQHKKQIVEKMMDEGTLDDLIMCTEVTARVETRVAQGVTGAS